MHECHFAPLTNNNTKYHIRTSREKSTLEIIENLQPKTMALETIIIKDIKHFLQLAKKFQYENTIYNMVYHEGMPYTCLNK